MPAMTFGRAHRIDEPAEMCGVEALRVLRSQAPRNPNVGFEKQEFEFPT